MTNPKENPETHLWCSTLERETLLKLEAWLRWHPNNGEPAPFGLATEQDCLRLIREVLG